MASWLMRKSSSSMMKSITVGAGSSWTRSYAKVAVGTDLVSSASEVSLQRARSWDEGVSSKFCTSSLKDIFKDKKVVIFGLPGAFTGVCSAQHVPSYKKNMDKFKAKGVDSVICVAVNDPYVMNGWASKMEAKDAIEFYGDFDGSFHKSLDLGKDLSGALLGHRSERWSAYVVDGKVKVLNVEKVPSDFEVSGGENDAVHVHLSSIQPLPSSLEHRYVICDRFERQETLLRLLHRDSPESCTVFVGEQAAKSKKAGDAPSTTLLIEILKTSYKGSMDVVLLEEDMNFNLRALFLADVRQGGGHLLFSTNIAARGVDLPETTHVYNFDLPKTAVDYLHLAGRTGR